MRISQRLSGWQEKKKKKGRPDNTFCAELDVFFCTATPRLANEKEKNGSQRKPGTNDVFFFLKVSERKPADWPGLFVPHERESRAISGALRPTFSKVCSVVALV
jgi:hypothetical protein